MREIDQHRQPEPVPFRVRVEATRQLQSTFEQLLDDPAHKDIYGNLKIAEADENDFGADKAFNNATTSLIQLGFLTKDKLEELLDSCRSGGLK